MGDRVAIIGGKTTGRDHFPFPVETIDDSDVGPQPDNVYPYGFNVDNACLAYYRVKKWQIDVNLTRTVPDPPNPDIVEPIVGTYYAEAGATIDNGTVITDGYDRESDLVVPRVTASSDNATTSNFRMFATDDEFSNPIGKRIVWAGTLGEGPIYPMFYIDADSPGGPSTLTDPSTGHGGSVLNWLGNSFTLYSADTGYAGTIDVYPVEYWPYATKPPASLPVYDTSTGAQLRDPLS